MSFRRKFMAHTIYQVDAFTKQPFSGNPAGVCVLSQPADSGWMQNVALEMNLSETAFLIPQADGYDLRWFTPAAEVDLCGHATLASAHILWETGQLKPDQQARFHTRSGLLTASLNGDWIQMDFPAEPEEPIEAPASLAEALGVRPEYVGKNRFDLLVLVSSEAEVRSLDPDFNLLRKLDARGVIVTSRADSEGYDFVSRFFAPAVGVAEDPVTGSAHCCLGPFWASRLGKSDMIAYQASLRGGEVKVSSRGERVILGGQAITTLQCNLLLS
jgi:PhzF family phenazine biosynthesis protein